MKDGHILPPLRDWATALCTENEASFDAVMAKSGAPWSYLFKETHMKSTPPGTARAAQDDGSLADAVCSQLGLKPGTLSG